MFGIGPVEVLLGLLVGAVLVYFAVRGRVSLPVLVLLVILLSPLVAMSLFLILGTAIAAFAAAQ